jgi:hypothetical protein
MRNSYCCLLQSRISLRLVIVLAGLRKFSYGGDNEYDECWYNQDCKQENVGIFHVIAVFSS